MNPKHMPASEADIPPTKYFVETITGITDKKMIRMILATGASRKDIRAAYNYYFEDYHILQANAHPMDKRTRAVYDLLVYHHSTVSGGQQSQG